MERLLEKQTLMISTVTQGGEPAISYAPFVKVENKFYIYISRTAEHHQNMVNHPRVAVMLIADEQETKVQFARERVSFNCAAGLLTEVDERIWAQFEERYTASMVGALRGLDFDMFELDVLDGRLVKGFGQAFNIRVEEDKWELEQVMGKGHGAKRP